MFGVSLFLGLFALVNVVYPLGYLRIDNRMRAFGIALASFFAAIVSIVLIGTVSGSDSSAPKMAGKATEQVVTTKFGQNSVVTISPKSVVEKRVAADILSAVNSGNFELASTKWRANSKSIGDAKRKEVETLALAAVKPLPGSALQKNLDGYKFLSLVNPKNSAYGEKFKIYLRKLIDAEASKKKRLLGSLRKKTDKISGTTFYQHKNRPKYTNSRSTVYLYLGKNGGSFYPRMIIQYAAKDWLFVNKVTLYADGSSFPFYQGAFKRDNHTRIWEWVDVTPSTVQLGLLKRASTSKEVILRFEGQQYRKDVKLRAKDKRALKDVLAVYELVK